MQLGVAFRTTIRAYLLQNRLFRAQLLYIKQQRVERGGIQTAIVALFTTTFNTILQGLQVACGPIDSDLRHSHVELDWMNESNQD